MATDRTSPDTTSRGASRARGERDDCSEPDRRTPYEVVLQHRAQIGRALDLVEQQQELLDFTIDHAEVLRERIRALTAADRNGQRRARLLKQLSLPVQVAALADMAAATEVLIRLERQAYGLAPGELPADLAAPAPMQAPLAPPAPEVPEDTWNRIRERVRATLQATRVPPSADGLSTSPAASPESDSA